MEHINRDNIWHVVPCNDLKPHKEFVSIYWDILKQVVECRCACKPVIEYREEGILVIHNSFDGREHFEYPSKVRDN